MVSPNTTQSEPSGVGVKRHHISDENGHFQLKRSRLDSLGAAYLHTQQVRINLPSPVIFGRKLGSICSTLVAEIKQKRPVRLLLSVQNCTLYAHAQPEMDHSHTSTCTSNDYITLGSILREIPNVYSLPKRWTLSQRMSLAFKIASALLQYQSTPWISGAWSKHAIHFQRTGSSGTVKLFDVEHPFITHTFTDHPIPSATPARQKLNAKRSLLELGILLLEIFHEETIENYASVMNLPLDDTYGRQYDAARKWLEMTEGEAPLLLWDAAALCIECPFNRSSTLPDWDDAEFRKSVCDGVLKPLWENSPRQSR